MKKLLVAVFLVGLLVLAVSAQPPQEQQKKASAECAEIAKIPKKKAEDYIFGGKPLEKEDLAFMKCYWNKAHGVDIPYKDRR